MKRRHGQLRRGRKLARSLKEPRVVEVKGVNVVTQEVQEMSADDLLALAEYYKEKYGDGS